MVFIVLSVFGCNLVLAEEVYVPYEYKWGIYELDPNMGLVSLIYSSPDKVSNVRLSSDGSKLVFSHKLGGEGYEYEEICIINVDGSGFMRLTNNMLWDIYPVWSPDSSMIAFLSMNETLDIYTMNADGSNCTLLYDSGYHDSDPHWRGDKIAFTREYQIWIMSSDGTGAHNITDPPRAGESGSAVLPFGDYDPRISPDGSSVVFERLVDDSSPHGNYDIFIVDIDGNNLRNITRYDWTQGMAVWASTGNSLVYTVSAKGETGFFDIYTINPDGTNMTDLTSALLPPTFLCHTPIYSRDDVKTIFIGEWWDWKILDSTIVCNILVNEAALRVELTGNISPIVVGADVEVKIVQPNSNIVILNTTTNTEGEYSVWYTAPDWGDYTFSSYWNGDEGHEPSDSGETTLTILEPDINLGIPGYPMEAIILSLIAYVLIKRVRA